MRPWPSSLRARLTLWYTVLLSVPLIIFAVVSYLIFAAALDRRTDRFIGDALTAFAGELSAERRTALTAVDAMRSTIDEVRFRDLQVTIVDSVGRVVVATPNPDPAVQAALLSRLGRDRAATAFTLRSVNGNARVLARTLSIDVNRYRLTGAYPLGDVEEVLGRIRAMFLVAIPILVLSAATGGYFLARRSLAPVAAMGAQAASITASSLDQRLTVGGEGGDELVGLGQVINRLLDRLEEAFAQQRRFVADASHELRTPAAILRTEADVTLTRGHRPEAEYRASMGVIQSAATRLTRIVEELFLLARSDAGHLVARPEPIQLEDVVDEAVRAVQAVAERRGVRIELRHLIEAPATGDPDLLGRLLLNLLDNAIKYSPPGGVVEVTMVPGDGRCEITVFDSGPGIPATAQAHIFERFFRVDSARSRSESSTTSGAGLGLAIARRIADMHAGHLDLTESRPGRTGFRLTLPVKAIGAAE